MDQNTFNSAKEYYQQGNWAAAASILTSLKRSDQPNGSLDHILGNCYMKLGMFSDAAYTYEDALKDAQYGNVGPLSANLARAYFAQSQFDNCIRAAKNALSDSTYASPYKAFLSMGNAYLQLQNYQEAGSAFRSAAMDHANPDPARALIELGHCFMHLGRPNDAVEAYRTALDFINPLISQSEIYAFLGRAYVNANKMDEALDAFNTALSDTSYTLSDDCFASYEACKRAIAARERKPSETEQFLQQAGYSLAQTPYQSVDPLDPMGKSGEIIPSPDDTGFFTFSEHDVARGDIAALPKKKKHIALKIFIFLLFLLVLAGFAGGFAYYKGYGWPTQQDTVKGLFVAKTSNSNIDQYLASNLSAQTKAEISKIIPANTQVSIQGVDQSMTNSTVLCEAVLAQGGKQLYQIELVRENIGWKVVKVQPKYLSQTENPVLTGSPAAQTTQPSNAQDSSQQAPQNQQQSQQQTSNQDQNQGSSQGNNN